MCHIYKPTATTNRTYLCIYKTYWNLYKASYVKYKTFYQLKLQKIHNELVTIYNFTAPSIDVAVIYN